MAERIVVVGGTRSGKSEVAEQMVDVADVVTYVATAMAGDAEMAQRIAAHRARRPARWRTVETTDLAAAITEARDGAVLIDGLGSWLTERMTAHQLWPPAEATVAPLRGDAATCAEQLLAELDAAWAAAGAHPGGPVVVVAEDVGGGLVPPDPASRRWVDLAGAALQRLSLGAERALWVVAGRAVELPGACGGDPIAAAGSTPPARAGDAGDDGRNVDLRAHGDQMVPPGALDLAVNVQPGGPPPHLAQILADAVGDAGAYPDDGPARGALAARHGLPAEAVLPVAGAVDGLWTLASVLRPRLAVVVHPQFTEAEAAVRAVGCRVDRAHRDPAQGWRLQAVSVPDDADLVVVGNPTNPLGLLDDPESILALRRPGRVVVVDEAFVDFVEQPERWSAASHAAEPGLVVVRSPTKLWGCPGVRAGCLLAAPQLVGALARRRRPWAVGTVGLAALTVTADDEAYRRAVAARVAAARADLLDRLALTPEVQVAAPPAANFVCLRVTGGSAVHEGLLEAGVAVRPSTFPGLSTDHLRVAVRDRDANARFVAALANVLRSRVGQSLD